jgi:hypothetical protein
MANILDHSPARYPETLTPFGWIPASVLALLTAAGAVIALLAGIVPPDTIGADGLAGTWLGAP